MAFSEVFPLADVRNRTAQVYQVELTNWGNLGIGGAGAPAADANSLISPEFKIAPTAIAIDPQSEVRQAIIRPKKNGSISTSGALESDDLVIDKDTPLMGRFTFPRRPPYDGSWGVVCFSSDRWGTVYDLKTGLGVPMSGSPTDVVVAPTLRLLIYIDANLPIPMIPRRSPFVDQRLTTASPGTIISQNVFPIAGRKCVRVTATPQPGTGGNTFQFRGISPAPPAGNGGDGVEFDLGTFTLGDANPANDANKSILIEDPCCQFLRVLCDGDSCLYSINAED